MNNAKNLISEISKKTIDRTTNIWINSPFEFLQKVSADERGKWGEELFSEFLKKFTNYDVIWEGDRNTNNFDKSIYDILINNFKTEVKTATKGSKKDIWQHENIYKEPKWDKLVFIDVDLFGIYFTIHSYEEMPFDKEKHKLLNKKSTKHLSAWKFDLTKKHMEILEKNKMTFYYDLNEPNDSKLSEFLQNKFNSNY